MFATMQKPDQVVIDLNTKMFANRIRPGDACRDVGVAPSTWSRWAAGGPVNLTTLRKVEARVDELIAAKAEAAGA